MSVIKKISFSILFGLLLFGIGYLWRALPIISGYGAKNLCSCVYISKRSVQSVLDNELSSFLVSLGTFSLQESDNSALGSVFGLAKKKAIYRKNLGCTLVSEVEEQTIRSQKILLNKITKPSDSLSWPFGSNQNDTIFDNVDYNQLNNIVNKAFEENFDEKINTRAVLVIYNNKIIAEQYGKGFDKNTPQIGWSMTKSIIATVVGMAIKDSLTDIDQKKLFDFWESHHNDISLNDLLQMKSGLDWDENYSKPSSATNMLFRKADMGDYASKQLLKYVPGKYWYYSSGTTNIISSYLKKILKNDYYNYIRDRLFSPLGMESAVLELDASATYVGSSYMFATPRDWAKFGLLYLHDGRWNGKQILPSNWSKYVSASFDENPLGEYGAHFWINKGDENNPKIRTFPDAPIDLYYANGFEGQKIFIIPSKNIVIVRMGQTKNKKLVDYNSFIKDILSCIK